jgi:Rhodopirellula transposase DDE domain
VRNGQRAAICARIAGLKVYADLDPGIYVKGRKVTDEEFATLHLRRSRFHGEWNYVIRPNR